MIVLDTDTLTIIQRTDSTDYDRLVTRLDASNEQVCVTIISFEEQMRGWLAWIAKARTPERLTRAYAKLSELLEDFQARPVLAFDADATSTYQSLAKLKTRVGTLDLRIAAICLTRNALLLSRNLSDFRRVPGLRVEDWSHFSLISTAEWQLLNAPKGRNKLAQGNALGNGRTPQSAALKGRNRTALLFVAPFQGSNLRRIVRSQGVALG